MNTFLPHKSFVDSAKALDTKRLGKQRVEVKQLLIAIYLNELRGNIWLAESAGIDPVSLISPIAYKSIINHPAKLMWEDYPFALVAYGLAICHEFKSRGYRDNTYNRLEAFVSFSSIEIYPEQSWMETNCPTLLPPWLGDERLHASHRSNLKRKDSVYYGKWTEPTSLDYFWPGRDYVK